MIISSETSGKSVAFLNLCKVLTSRDAKKKCLKTRWHQVRAKESFSVQSVLHQRYFSLFLQATSLPDQNINDDREILAVWRRSSSSWQADLTSNSPLHHRRDGAIHSIASSVPWCSSLLEFPTRSGLRCLPCFALNHQSLHATIVFVYHMASNALSSKYTTTACLFLRVVNRICWYSTTYWCPLAWWKHLKGKSTLYHMGGKMILLCSELKSLSMLHIWHDLHHSQWLQNICSPVISCQK